MWQVSSCKEIDSFMWSPKGYTIKKGKEAAYDDRISMYPTEKDGYNSYFDLIVNFFFAFTNFDLLLLRFLEACKI